MSARRPARPPRDMLAILVGRGRVTLAATGDERPIELEAGHERFAPDELRGLLEEYFEQRRLRGRVVLGVDPTLDFLATRPRGAATQKGGSADLVEELEDRHGDRLVIEERSSGRGGDALQTVYAAPRAELLEAAQAVRAQGRARIRIAGTTAAIAAWAEALEPTPAGWTSEIRFFPGKRRSLAVFVCGGAVLNRQVIATAELDDAGIAAELYGMWAAVQEGLRLPPPPGLILHCGDSGHELAAACRRATAVEARLAPHVGFDRATLCTALAAEAGRRRGGPEPLFRGLLDEVGGGEPARMPIVSLAGTGAALALVAAMLHQTARGLDTEVMALDARTREAVAKYGRNPLKLAELLDDMKRNATVAESFLMDRVYWADFLGEVPELMPGDVALERLEGTHPFVIPRDDDEAVRMPDAFLELTLSVPVREGATRIPQVPQLTSALRASQLFSRHFKHVPNAAVTVRPDAAEQVARVSIRCSRSKR